MPTSCDECVKLWADSAALFLEFLNAKDALTLTGRTDPAYLARPQELLRYAGNFAKQENVSGFTSKVVVATADGQFICFG